MEIMSVVENKENINDLLNLLNSIRESMQLLHHDWSDKSIYAKSIRAIGDDPVAINDEKCLAKAACAAYKAACAEYKTVETKYNKVIQEMNIIKSIQCRASFCFRTINENPHDWRSPAEYIRRFECSEECPHRDNIPASRASFEKFNDNPDI